MESPVASHEAPRGVTDPQRRSRAVVVLGMHRSGTSALAGVLNRLGVDFGSHLIAPNQDNPRGYWEHDKLVKIHERLLGDLGSAWDRFMPQSRWWDEPDVLSLRDEIAEVVRADFDGSALWGVKDPRMCRLLPVWKPVFESEGVDPCYVIILRHPLEVAKSLSEREGFTEIRSLALWLEHLLVAEKETESSRRVFISFDNLLRDWHGIAASIGDRLSICWPHTHSSVATEISRFLDSDLRHHGLSETDRARKVPLEAESVFRALSDLGTGRVSQATAVLARARQNLSELQGLVASLGGVGEDPRWRDVHELKKHMANLEDKIEEVERDREGYRVHSENLQLQLARVDQRANAQASRACRRTSTAELVRQAQENTELRGRVASLESGLEMTVRSLNLEKSQRIQSEKRLQTQEDERTRLRELLENVRSSLNRSRAMHSKHLKEAGELKELSKTLREEVDRLRQELERSQQGASGLQALYLGALEKNVSLEGELDSVRSSRSWRVTRPLRVFVRGARSFGSRIVRSIRLPSSNPLSPLRFLVEVFEERRDPLTGRELLVVAGWCFSHEGSGKPVRLEVRGDGAPLGEGLCEIERRDVQDHFSKLTKGGPGTTCGFSFHLYFTASVRKFELVSPQHGVVLASRMRDETSQGILSGPCEIRDAMPPPGVEADAYARYREVNAVTPRVRDLLSQAITRSNEKPVLSVVMPVFNTDPEILTEAIESVLEQIYPYWQLCIADDGSHRSETVEVLRKYNEDPRIEVVTLDCNRGICHASNEAASLAKGEFLSFLDHDDVLAANALFEVARVLEHEPEADIIYSDEDKISSRGVRYDPQFKPDWSPTLFLGYNYLNHLTSVRRELFESIGGFRPTFEGAQDYDLLLRLTELTARIVRIPKVLYHWRAVPGSTALSADEKPIVRKAAYEALKDRLDRCSINAVPYPSKVAQELGLPISQLDWSVIGPEVTIIIPTRNQHLLLSKCLDSILKKTTYENYSILVVDNGSDSPTTLQYLGGLPSRGIEVLRVVDDERGFSFSRLNNIAAKAARGEFLLFLNDDCEVLEESWLSRLVGYCRLPGVGATGAQLLYPDGRIQHAGVLLNHGEIGRPDHAFQGDPSTVPSYYFLAETSREVSAVTGACLLTKRSLFDALGGFDEGRFPVSLNDIDYCLRLRERGLSTVYVADALLLHHESSSRTREDDPAELARYKVRHPVEDRFYNPNLSSRRSFKVGRESSLGYENYLKSKLRLLCVVPSFNLEGGPKILLNVAHGLTKSRYVEPMVLGFSDGDLRREFEGKVRCKVVNLPGTGNVLADWADRGGLDAATDHLQRHLEELRPDVVFISVLNNYFVVEAAERLGIPTVWFVQESYSEAVRMRLLQSFALPRCEAAFSKAFEVVFGSYCTRSLYERLNAAGNFSVLYNSLSRAEIEAVRTRPSKLDARRRLGLREDCPVIVSVGTICARKDQETLVRALKILRQDGWDMCALLVGARVGDPYTRYLEQLVETLELESVVRLVPETEDVHTYYAAADIFAFSSMVESYPFVMLEAMAHGLPIVTTSPCGVREQVRLGVNALCFDFGDSEEMARQLGRLLSDKKGRVKMGQNSFRMLEYFDTPEALAARHERLAFTAWSACSAASQIVT